MDKNKGYLIILIGILAIAQFGLFSLFETQKVQAKFLKKLDISSLDAKTVIQHLDSRLDEPKELVSSITGNFLTLKDGESKIVLRVPKDGFYLSFAPYENQIHPCVFHNLNTCRGELMNVVVHALITDSEGAVILNEDFETMDNGFIGVWLPRNIIGNVNVTYNGKIANAPITTFADSETCLTTPLKLS